MRIPGLIGRWLRRAVRIRRVRDWRRLHADLTFGRTNLGASQPCVRTAVEQKNLADKPEHQSVIESLARYLPPIHGAAPEAKSKKAKTAQ